MADKRDEDQLGKTEGQAGQQQTIGQQGQQAELSEQGQSSSGPAELDSGSEALTGERRNGETDGVDSGSAGEGFVGSQGTGSGDYLQERGSDSGGSAEATGGTDFAEKGQGAIEDEDDGSGTGSAGGGLGSGGGGSF